MRSLKYLLLYEDRRRDKKGEFANAKDYFGTLSDDDADMVLRYMQSGLVLWEFVSPTIDPLGSNARVRNIAVTDGTFAWDGVLEFWVSRYRVALPAEFLDHVRSTGLVDVESLIDHEGELQEAFKKADIVTIPSDNSSVSRA